MKKKTNRYENRKEKEIGRRELYTVDEARALLGGISRTFFYALLRAGDIRAVKLGRRTFVPQSEIATLLDKLRDDDAAEELIGLALSNK